MGTAISAVLRAKAYVFRRRRPTPIGHAGVGEEMATRVNPTGPGGLAASIGPSMRIKGEIRSQEDMQIDGEVEGLMESQSLVSVGPKGKVRADIKAREVVVYGDVRGNIEVSHKLAIRDQGRLVGDVKCAGISIDDGAYFKGSIDIVRGESKTAAG